jgi:hypothetical protein
MLFSQPFQAPSTDDDKQMLPHTKFMHYSNINNQWLGSGFHRGMEELSFSMPCKTLATIPQ